MAKCGCAGTGCACAIAAGARVSITGTGAAQNPFRIDADPITLVVTDTATVNLTLNGDGSIAAPYSLTADFVGELTAAEWSSSTPRTWGGAVSMVDVITPRTLRVALVGNVTAMTLPSWSSTNSGRITLVLTQDTTGGRTVVWSGVTWEGAPPELSTAANARDVVELFWTGLSWVGIPVAMNVA